MAVGIFKRATVVSKEWQPRWTVSTVVTERILGACAVKRRREEVRWEGGIHEGMREITCSSYAAQTWRVQGAGLREQLEQGRLGLERIVPGGRPLA